MKGKRGFTLIELLVVVIIIAILASIAFTMMADMKARAICTEALAGIGAINTAVRTYYSAYNRYPTPSGDVMSGTISEFPEGVLRDLGLSGTSLDGRYFSSGCYFVYFTTEMPELNSIVAWFYGPYGASPEAVAAADSGAAGRIIFFPAVGKFEQGGVTKSGFKYMGDPDSYAATHGIG